MTTTAEVLDENWEVLRQLAEVRILLGCHWGDHIATEDDRTLCTARAVRAIVLHDGPQQARFQFCEAHAVKVESLTDPHQEEAPS